MASAAKEQFVQNLTDELKTMEYFIVADYQGLNAEQFTELRTTLNGAGAKFKVVKNRLAKIALNNVGKNVKDAFKGPSALAYQGGDVASLSKILSGFYKKHKLLKVKAGFAFGEQQSAQNIQTMADLPSKEVLLSTLLARMNAPLQSLAATMNEPLRSLHSVISAVAKKQEAAPAA